MSETTVLVVEDNETLRNVLRRMLECGGRHVLLAANAESALGFFEHSEERIDVVISDDRLPEMSGSRLAEELGRRDPAIAILLMSGGFDGPPGEFPQLDKPFTLEELEQRIAEVLEAAASGSQSRIRDEL